MFRDKNIKIFYIYFILFHNVKVMFFLHRGWAMLSMLTLKFFKIIHIFFSGPTTISFLVITPPVLTTDFKLVLLQN